MESEAASGAAAVGGMDAGAGDEEGEGAGGSDGEL